MGHRMGEMILLRVASFGDFGDRWATWVGKTENFGDFIKAFSDSIIFGGADNLKLLMSGHFNNLSVPTRNNEGKEGKRGCGVWGKRRRRGVV